MLIMFLFPKCRRVYQGLLRIHDDDDHDDDGKAGSQLQVHHQKLNKQKISKLVSQVAMGKISVEKRQGMLRVVCTFR